MVDVNNMIGKDVASPKGIAHEFPDKIAAIVAAKTNMELAKSNGDKAQVSIDADKIDQLTEQILCDAIENLHGQQKYGIKPSTTYGPEHAKASGLTQHIVWSFRVAKISGFTAAASFVTPIFIDLVNHEPIVLVPSDAEEVKIIFDQFICSFASAALGVFAAFKGMLNRNTRDDLIRSGVIQAARTMIRKQGAAQQPDQKT